MGRVRQYIPDEIDRATRKMTKGRTTDIDDVLIDMLLRELEYGGENDG